MPLRFVRSVVLVLTVAAAGRCGGTVDLTKALQITDVLSGYYDDGLTANGWNHLLPSLTFRVKNVSADPLASVDLTVAFWKDGSDGENDSVLTTAVGGSPLAPGGSTDALTVRAPHGYNLEGARADFFQHSTFQDFTAKVFGKHGGHIYKLGEFKIDRNIIPHMAKSQDRP